MNFLEEINGLNSRKIQTEI